MSLLLVWICQFSQQMNKPMSLKQNMQMLNIGLSIFAKLQTIKIKNEKIKAINKANRVEQALIAEWQEPKQITGEKQ